MSLDTTPIVSKTKIVVVTPLSAKNKVSSAFTLRDNSLSKYMKNKIRTSRMWQKWCEMQPNVVWSPIKTTLNVVNIQIQVIMEYLVKISKMAGILELKRRYFEDYYSDIQYAVSIKEDTAYLCLHFTRNHEDSSINTRTTFGLRPYHFTYPERKLTMEEMLYKFIDEGKRDHEEMRAFINEFRTTNELLFKERNNSLRLEKSINQSDLESCESLGNKSDDDSDLEKPIRRIDSFNTPYSVAQETTRPDGVESEHLYSDS
ncbi:hypothetical protein Tco_0458699 [Tanacetum coccineum]